MSSEPEKNQNEGGDVTGGGATDGGANEGGAGEGATGGDAIGGGATGDGAANDGAPREGATDGEASGDGAAVGRAIGDDIGVIVGDAPSRVINLGADPTIARKSVLDAVKNAFEGAAAGASKGNLLEAATGAIKGALGLGEEEHATPIVQVIADLEQKCVSGAYLCVQILPGKPKNACC